MVTPDAVRDHTPKATKAPEEFVDADDHTLAKIRSLLPEAAGVSREEFANAATNLDDFENQSLTVLVLVGVKLSADDEEFRPLPIILSPDEMLDRLGEGGKSVSILNPGFIRTVTCQVRRDRAMGTVSFESVVSEGRVYFQAERIDGEWRVSEFRLPGLDWTTALDKRGRWRAWQGSAIPPELFDSPEAIEPTPADPARLAAHESLVEELTTIHRDALAAMDRAERGRQEDFRQRIRGLLSDRSEMQKQIDDLEAERDELQERYRETLERLAQAERALRQSGVDPLGLPEPPPPIEGQVLSTKSVGGDGAVLVELSVGEDDGVTKGMKLHGFRLGTDPKYLGQVAIVYVAADRAVGRVVKQVPGSEWKRGDQVSTKID